MQLLLSSFLITGLLVTAGFFVINASAQNFSLGGQTYPNHGLVTIDDIGTNISDPDNRLHCVSDDVNCCSIGSQFRGEFDFPDGTQVPVLSLTIDGYYRNRDFDRVFLNRQSTGTTQGLFRCRIVTSQTSAVSPAQLYIGVYDANSGSPNVTSLEYDDTTRTLTCVTTGGPATTITWRRNCVSINLASPGVNFTQTVTDQAAATYMNVLTLPSPIEDGSYSCTVTNARGSDTAMVVVGSSPIVVSIFEPAPGPALGSSHTLTCNFTGAMNSTTVQWRNGTNGMLLTTGGDVTVTDTAPYQLTFSQLRQSHLGDYYCEVRAGGDEGCFIERVAQSVSVVVAGGTATAGTSHDLTCTVVSGVDLFVPGTTAMYTWRKGARMLQSSTSSLYTIDSVGVGDAGDDYQCDVTVTASYLDITGSISASNRGSLFVQLPQPLAVTLFATPTSESSHYTGLELALTCSVFTTTVVAGVTANIQVANPRSTIITNDTRITIDRVRELSLTSGAIFSRRVNFRPLSASVDSGSYTCSGALVPLEQNSFVMDSPTVTSSPLPLTVTNPSLLVNVLAMDTRVLNIEPYNNFTLMCMAASSFNGTNVNIQKTITWTRRIGSGQEETLTNSPGNVTITNDDLNQATSTSTLLVATTIAGQHRYTCSSQLVVTPAMDVITGNAQQTINIIGPTPPSPVTGVMVITLGDDSTTIQFTVSSLTYDPETYIVQYGTSIGNLNRTSSMETSGTDLDRTNFTLAIILMNLVPSTEYFYRVVATNSGGSTETPSGPPLSFTTTAQEPDPPTGLMIKEIVNDTTITLNWTAPVNTFGVLIDNSITCQPVIQELPQVSVNVSGSQTSATVSGLENGARYDCSVVVQNNAGLRSDPSTSIRIMAAEIAPDGPPQNYEIVPLTPGRNVQFSWTPPLLLNRNGDIINYNLTCASVEGIVTANYSTAGTYTLSGFKAVTAYTCSIYAQNTAGTGPPDSLTATTREDIPDGPPLNIQGRGVDGMPLQVSISWQPPLPELSNGEITGYNINCGSSVATTDQLNVLVDVSMPATIHNCLVAAATRVGPGANGSVQALTVPGQPVVMVEGRSRSLLVTWSYNSPPLSEAVIDGYRVFLNSMMVQDVNSSQMQFTIPDLNVFTNYSVTVLAYNTVNGVVQVGPMSDPVTATTLGDVSGPPVCPQRWSLKSLSSISISWQPPTQPNGIITGYFLELVSFDNQTVLQSADVANVLSYNFTGFTLGVGVPYHVRVYAVNTYGRGSYCTTTDFGGQLSPPSNILTDFTASFEASGSSETRAVLTWTVLPLDQAKGYISLSITFGPLTNTAARQKRQASGETVECAQSPCQVPYEQGRVRILGLDSEQDNFIIVIPENEEGEIGTPVTTGIAAETTCAPCTCPSSTSGNSTTVYAMAAVLVLLLLLLFMAVLVIVVLFVRKKRSEQQSYDLSAINVGSDKTDILIMTNQCEAYGVMKLQDRPRGQATTATGPEQMYDEVGEGLATGSGRGRYATPTQVLGSTAYEEVGEGLISKATPSQKKGKPGSSHQEEEASHYD